MNILITENQYKVLIERHEEFNNKPAKDFDQMYGTALSHTYDFGDGLTSDDVWKLWTNCRDNDECDGLKPILNNLQNSFPYYDMGKLDIPQKVWVIQGMASEFSPSDIVYFSIHGATYKDNADQKRLESHLPDEVKRNIRWVLSPDSIEVIKNRFGIYEI